MVKTFKKVIAMLLVGIVTLVTPVNVFAMSGTDDEIMLLGYGQHDSCSKDFSMLITATGVYGAHIGVSGTIRLNYEWDEGYDSQFTSGSGSASVTSIPDGIASDGWSVEVRHMSTTGRTIRFKVVLFRNGNEVGSSDISYYVDEYGQVS